MSIRAVLWAALLAIAIGVVGVGRPSPEIRGAERGSRSSEEASDRAAFVATRQARAARDSAYALERSPDGRRLSANVGADLVAQIDEGGLSWAPRDRAWRATLSTRSYGCEGSVAPVEPLSPPRIAETPNRSTIDERAGDLRLSEWYVHGPLGLEQGWTLDRGGCGASEARIDVAVTGLLPAENAGGRGIELRDHDGMARLRYSDLWARDADGKALASRMTVSEGAIEIRVDTRGARFPVVVDPLVWVSPQNLTPPDLATVGGSQFGGAVAVSGANAVVGGRFGTGGLSDQGVIYAFHRVSGVWGTPQEIFAPDPVAGGAFGGSLALSGTTMVVGAAVSTVGATQNQGAVYVYTQANGVWGSPQKLVAADGGAFDTFGAPDVIGATSIAISGSTIVVGAFQSTAAYVFALSGGTFVQQQKLVPTDAVVGMQFGASVAISGSTIVVGANNATIGSQAGVGAAYVFTQSGSTWTQTAKLVPPTADQASQPFAGSSVAISGSTVFSGAPSAMVGANRVQGAVYVYTQSGSTFSAPVTLLDSPGAAFDKFGGALAVSGNTLVVGPFSAAGGGAPDVWLFQSNGGAWTQQIEIAAPDANFSFGNAIGFDGTTLISGAWNFTSAGIVTAGEVFIGPIALSNGSACSAGASCATGFCVGSVCCDSTCTAPCATCATGACGTAAQHATPQSSCGGYLCNGTSTACPSACAVDGDCTSGFYCGGDNTCHAQRAQGIACNTAAASSLGDCSANGCRECAAGACFDKVCCATASCPTCQACSTALQASGGTNGVCSAALVNTDPHTNCPSTSTCNGKSACALKNGQPSTSSNACVSNNASDGVCCNTACGSGCDVCTTALGSSANGTCAIAAAGTVGDGCGAGIACNGATAACPGTTCASDANCLAGFYCGSGGTCQPQKAQGASCNVAPAAGGGDCLGASCRECTGALSCFDGVCCGTATCPACQACAAALQAPGGTSGTCAASLVNTDPHASCPSSSTCNGASACALKNGQPSASAAACVSGALADGVCCQTACASQCDVCTAALGSSADGTCAPARQGTAGSPACGMGIACNGTNVGCPGSTCASDASCLAGFYCGSGGACEPQKTQGGSCNVAAATGGGDCLGANCRECTGSLSCFDGVCCGTATCPSCQACSAVLQAPGGTPGTCSPSLVNTDPHASCTSTQTCNGSGACGLKNGQTSTSVNACVSGNVVDGVCCDPSCGAACQVCTAALGSTADGTCAPARQGAAGNPTCGTGVACNGASPACPGASCSSDAACLAGFFCGSTGTCQPERAQGAACNLGAGSTGGDCLGANCHECTGSLSCVDGVCCGTATCPSCQACSATKQAPGGTSGTCSPALANSDPHTDCTTASTCDGASACALKNGQHATIATACLSGVMAGGVCCNVACPSDCYACTVALGATADGQCTSLADGTACSLGTCQAAACKAPVDAGIDGAAPVVDASVADAARDATTDASADAEPDATTAMTSKDATVDAPAHDAGAPHDGAVAETGAAASEDSGDTGDFTRTPPSCSCRTAGGRTTSSTPFFAAVLFVGAVVARRRTRAAAPSGPSRRPRGAAVAWLVLLVVSLGGRSARADDDAQNKASARALATAGFEAFRAEHWAEAADRFSRAESLVHAPAHLLYLARSYGHLGKLVAAHETYEKLTRETLPDTAPQAARHAQEDGAKELGALEAHLPKLVVTVAPAPPGLTVEMDGARLSSAVLGVAIPVDPGQHTLVAKADGFAPAERSVDAADGVRTVVALSMEALSSTPPVAAGTPGPALANPPPLPEKDATASSGGGLSALRVAGIVSLVVAAGAGGAGAFFAIQSHDNRAQGDQLCMPNGCMKVNEDQINDFDNKATLYGELAVASFITAGAAAAFGVTALVLPQHGSSSEPKAALWVGPTSIGVRGSF